ncbi:MAG: hypothetical protein ACTSYB_13100 [Candidatus Helarchaeota archaeon]
MMKGKSETHIYILNKLRASSLKFAEFIQESSVVPEILLLNFPSTTQKLLEAYGNGLLSDEEFWNTWQELFDLSDPFIKALQYQFTPIVQTIPLLRFRNPQIQLIPYQDDQALSLMKHFKEQLLLLTYRTRVTRKIDLTAWKEYLFDEYEWNKSCIEQLNTRILMYLQKTKQNAILYQGDVKSLRQILLEEGYIPKVKHFGRYWRAPLEVLSYLIGTKGLENIPDKCIQECIKAHITYIDYILSTPTIDDAHDRWTGEKIKKSL